MRSFFIPPIRLETSSASAGLCGVRPWCFFRPVVALMGLLVLALAGAAPRARGEAMLQLFNVNWDELIQKMPEIAEAGYTSLWLPPPAKGASIYSVGYDLFDPFDLGDKNQRGTIRTKYGTKAQLVEAVELAHRFGLRVYFDNIMNHRGFEVPGFNAGTPTNLYPGLSPQDFHLRTQSDGTFRNWPNVSNWNSEWEVQYRSLLGLVDLANEPGGVNGNFGVAEGNTTAKPSYVRHPGLNSYYMDTNLPAIAGPWRPFNGTNGDPVAEDVNTYLARAAIWTLSETKCDGFRLDAVKHTPATFFGDTAATANGYLGAIQTMFDHVHGYGNNVTGNGYVEPDDNRNSCYDSETTRNDALLFGEHLGEPPSYGSYLSRGMRLLDTPLSGTLNSVLGDPGASLSGLDQRDSGGFAAAQRVMYAQSHDNAYANRRELQLAYMFLREGAPLIYSDGYNEAVAAPGQDPFPRIARAPYLGQFNDNQMPDLAWLHHQLARGGTRPRWSDADIVVFERYDYRETANAYNNPDATVVLFAMNDNYGNPGDISFDDSVAQNDAGLSATCYPVVNSRARGLVVGFPPGSWLTQLADSPGKDRACSKLLVRLATGNLADAQASANDPNPVNRKVYVGGQTLAPGGGAIEFKIPSGGYVAYGYQWPEASRAAGREAITFRQNGGAVPRLTVQRRDGINGDSGFNPLYPFKMRGSVDAQGNVVRGANLSNKVYTIEIPVLTNAPFDLGVQCDASATIGLLKLDGGLDLNSQLGLGPTTGLDRRDNRPGVVTDIFLGYEQTQLQRRQGPEKFAASTIASNTIVSSGAETFSYTVGGGSEVMSGSGFGAKHTNSTADWVQHQPTNATTVVGGGPATQRHPPNPAINQAVEIWVKVAYQLQVNRCTLYYTTDGSNPEGAFGAGSGPTRVSVAEWIAADTADGTVEWWKGTIQASNHTAGAQIRYKVALFHDAIGAITDADDAKLYGRTEFGITNFNPTTATVWRHNNLNSSHTETGLREGFHIVRARTFLPRANKSSVFNTFAQTFYYDAQPPAGAIAFPATDGEALASASYTAVVRADASVTGVEFNIADADPNNDDAWTGQANGNGLTNGVPRFVSATAVTPNGSLNLTYSNLPQEFRFTYAAVPASGPGTITVRLKKLTSSVLPNRVTTLTRTVTNTAPGTTLQIVNPPTDGAILVLNTNTPLLIHACFSTGLSNHVNLYSIFINGLLQPRDDYLILASGCNTGQRSLFYYWNSPPPGTNTIQITYSNFFTLNDTRTIAVARPGDSDSDGMTDVQELIAGTNPFDPNSVLRITALASGNHLIVWDSVAGRNYQVLATTNLTYPMQVISPVLPASGPSSFYFDSAPDATNKFYRVQVVP